MLSANQVMVGGKVVGDVEVSQTGSGLDIAVFKVSVVEERIKFGTQDKETKETVVEIKAFGKSAMVVKHKLHDGCWVFVEGTINTMVGNNGRINTSIIAKKTHFVGPGRSKAKEEDEPDSIPSRPVERAPAANVEPPPVQDEDPF